MVKKTVLVICGGRTTEHSVSLLSAKNVLQSIARDKYRVLILVIDGRGGWFLVSKGEFEEIVKKGRLENGKRKYVEVGCLPNEGKGMRLVDGKTGKVLEYADVVFPMVHGKFGEDGTLQGMLEMMNVAYVGPGVMASALGMDKVMTKRILLDADIETAPFSVLHKGDLQKNAFRDFKKRFGLPFFVKPASCGSSVGVRKVCTEREFFAAVREAFFYDTKILVEEMIVGREIECAVMGNRESARASVLGEVVLKNGYTFYSYAAKYTDEEGSEVVVPAKLAPSVASRVRETALRVYRVLECEGMTRVDFFVTMRGRVYVNEVNTIPGFTNVSLYPRLWREERITGEQLTGKLIQFAFQRKKQQEMIRTRYEKK